MYVGYHGKPRFIGEEWMMLAIKAQEISFSTTNNVNLTHIHAKDQVVLELVKSNNTMDSRLSRNNNVGGFSFSSQNVH